MSEPARDRRFRRIREIGCLACRKRGWYVPPDVHHLNLGQHAGAPRLGDEYTIGLDPWHHRGIVPEGMTEESVRRMLGPSMAKEPVKFRETFGTDFTLLEEQNRLIAEMEQYLVGAA